MTDTNERMPLALIADDDELMQLMLKEVAVTAGFSAIVAENGAQAVDMAAEYQPDIILLDVNMPVMDGFSACKELRSSKELQLTPIIMVTGNDDTDSVNQAYQCGATDFISKPINWSLIGHRMRYILRGARNIKVMQARERKIHRLAYYESMTGLPNRALIREVTDELLASNASDTGQVALVFLDIEGFKRVNDSFGHSVGDEILLSISSRLKDSLKRLNLDSNPGPMLANVGGDEFIAMISGPDIRETASKLADAWTACLAEPFSMGGTELTMTPRIGISIATADGTNFEELMKSSSMALNHAKTEKSEHYAFFCESMHTEALERVQLESDLRDALRSGKLELHYQPKYLIDAGMVVGLEALIRWKDAENGWISPDTFIPVAEETGLIVDIARWVVPTVCKQIAEWSADGLAVPVAINMSAAHVLHGDPASLISASCEEYGVSPTMIEVEITESTLVTDFEKASSVLSELKSLGVELSIDDFGTGYSSLAYLRKFDIDTLKIDRSFITDVSTSADARSICRAIIAMAKQLSLKVVAEGVETFDQHGWLSAQNCDVVQGFLWARPMPALELRDLLLESNVVRLDMIRSEPLSGKL